MDRWQLATYVLPRWGDRPIDGITKQDVRGLVQDLAEGRLAVKGKPTKVAPRNLRALLSKLFDWAAEEGLLPGNPAAGVKLPMPVREHLKKGGRDRVLSDEEIGVLWKDLDWLDALAARQHQTPVSAAAFRLILLTAQRPGEVFRMRWRDLEDGTWWVIPAEVAKNGEFNRVPLSPQARKILHGLRPHTGDSEWVLESPYKAGSHLTTVKTASHGIVKRAGMRSWTPHDLRRTAVSKMRALGVDRRVVQAIGEYLRDELEARGWTQTQFAEIIGRPVGLVSKIINSKTRITPITAKEIAAALGTSAELWMRLDTSYQLAITPDPPETIAEAALACT
jgi:integrase